MRRPHMVIPILKKFAPPPLISKGLAQVVAYVLAVHVRGLHDPLKTSLHMNSSITN